MGVGSFGILVPYGRISVTKNKKTDVRKVLALRVRAVRGVAA